VTTREKHERHLALVHERLTAIKAYESRHPRHQVWAQADREHTLAHLVRRTDERALCGAVAYGPPGDFAPLCGSCKAAALGHWERGEDAAS
jgi:hypothetical protein